MQNFIVACMWCNPANGRVDFEGAWFIKSNFITKEEIKQKVINSYKQQNM
jgi:hypothetical protein